MLLRGGSSGLYQGKAVEPPRSPAVYLGARERTRRTDLGFPPPARRRGGRPPHLASCRRARRTGRSGPRGRAAARPDTGPGSAAPPPRSRSAARAWKRRRPRRGAPATPDGAAPTWLAATRCRSGSWPWRAAGRRDPAAGCAASSDGARSLRRAGPRGPYRAARQGRARAEGVARTGLPKAAWAGPPRRRRGRRAGGAESPSRRPLSPGEAKGRPGQRGREEKGGRRAGGGSRRRSRGGGPRRLKLCQAAGGARRRTGAPSLFSASPGRAGRLLEEGGS